MKAIVMKYSIYLGMMLGLISCRQPSPADTKVVPGRIADAKWFFSNGDTLLWLHSLFYTDHSEYSSSSIDRTSTYQHENSLFTVLRIKNGKPGLAYRQEAACINHQACGTRYMDEVIAFSSNLLAFNCKCEGKLSIIDIASGKEWANLESLSTKFEGCKPGITRYRRVPSSVDIMELEISDGQVLYLSLEEKRMTDRKSSFDSGQEPNKGSRTGEIAGQKVYFAPNDGDHRAFLVVRPLKSGTSQDYKHRMGNGYWLNPILLNRINSSDAYADNNAFYVLHSKTWNEYEDRDLLSKVTTGGETLYTIDLKPLGAISSFVPGEKIIYLTNATELYAFDAASGKKLSATAYNSIAVPGTK